VIVFKQKAVGQDVQEFESALREGLSKKYKDIKNEFLKACKVKALEFLDSDIQAIKKNLSNDMYDDLDKIKEDLEKLKTRFIEHGPKFSGRMEILSEIHISLLLKASDFMSITNKKESNQNARRLQDKIIEMEHERSVSREELRLERDRL